MLRVAVCEDDAMERQAAVELLRAYAAQSPATELKIQEFSSGKALLWSNSAAAFDLYLLDVLMPGLDGIAIGLELRGQGAQGEILYLTSSRDYAVESYQVGAFYYLLKPVSREALFPVLDRVRQRLARRQEGELLVHTAEGTRRILYDGLLWVERTGRRMVCRCADGETVVSTSLRASFAQTLEPLLREGRFAACGASYVVNLHHVSAVGGGLVTMDNGASVPLPRRAAAAFKRAWIGHWLEDDA